MSIHHPNRESQSQEPEKFADRYNVEDHQAVFFEEIYRKRLDIALHNLATILEQYTTKPHRVPNFHTNQEWTGPGKPFIQTDFPDVFAFPHTKLIGAKKILLTNRVFQKLPTLSKLYIPHHVQSDSGEMRFAPYRSSIFSSDLQENLLVPSSYSSESGTTEGQQLCENVGRECVQLAQAIDLEVSKEINALMKNKDVRLLVANCISDIAQNIEIKNTDEEPTIQINIEREIGKFIISRPSLIAHIIDQAGHFLVDINHSQNKLELSSVFSHQDLIDFEQWFHQKLGVLKKKEHDVSFHLNLDNSEMTALTKFLKAVNFYTLTTVYSLPREKFMKNIVLPTSWFRQGTWIIHWSGVANDLRTIGERVQFMGSDIAPEVLLQEPGIQEGLDLISSLERSQQSIRNCGIYYDELRNLWRQSPEASSAEYPDSDFFRDQFFPLIYFRSDIGLQIKAIKEVLQKNQPYSYLENVEKTVQEMVDWVNTTEKVFVQLTEAVEKPGIPQTVVESKKFSHALLEFKKHRQQTESEIAQIRTLIENFYQTLSKHARVTIPEYNHSEPTIPSTLDSEGELQPPISLYVDPQSKRPILDQTVRSRSVSLDDIMEEMNFPPESKQTTLKEKRKRE